MIPCKARIRLAAALVLAGATGPLAAKTWPVEASGRNTTISAAVAAAAAGDTIRVGPGTYAEGTITIGKKLTLIGLGRPLIDGGQQGDVLVIAAAGSTVQGFRITGTLVSNINDNAGIKVKDADTCR